MCVDSEIPISTNIVLTIERLFNNGVISSEVSAEKKTFCLSEDLRKLVNTNLKISHDIIESINVEPTKYELLIIEIGKLKMKLDAENAFNIFT